MEFKCDEIYKIVRFETGMASVATIHVSVNLHIEIIT